MLDCGVRPVAFPVHQSEFSDEVARPTALWAVVNVHDGVQSFLPLSKAKVVLRRGEPTQLLR